MFELYLKSRPIELGIDYRNLAQATENFVSSDIKFICDEASRSALKQNIRISQAIVMEVIHRQKPSISAEDLSLYENIRLKMEGKEVKNTQTSNNIGYKK